MQNNKDTDSFAFIIDGKTLSYVFKYKLENEFRNVCMECEAVLCCRMSPAQKADVIIRYKKWHFYFKAK